MYPPLALRTRTPAFTSFRNTASPVEAARAGAKPMYHDDRALRVFIVTDGVMPGFVECVER